MKKLQNLSDFKPYLETKDSKSEKNLLADYMNEGFKKSILKIERLTDYFKHPEINPFQKLRDENIFLHREKENFIKEQDRIRNKVLKVADKTTHSRQINSKPTMFFDKHDIKALKRECYYSQGLDDYSFVLKITKDQRVEKETLNEYVKKKREMFLLHYSIGVKKEEMNKLERLALGEEKKLELAEQYLEEDALMFDEFLKENDKSAGDAIKLADAEKKLKQEKDNELRTLNTQIMMIKGEITKYEEQLKEYHIYENFLMSLTPPEWLAQKMKERGESSNEEEEDEMEPMLYFTDPQQLLDIFGELEEQNLSLIQNSQETEESLEEMKQTYQATKDKMEKEVNMLKDQIETLRANIEKDSEEANALSEKANIFAQGYSKNDDGELLARLNKVVEEAYKTCVGELDGSMNTLQMLIALENKLEDIFQQIEMMPRNKFEAAVKIKEKERRLKQREEKMSLQRHHQEERMKKAMERAALEPRKKFGRKLMMRSEPPQVKKSYKSHRERESKQEEEMAYYFMP